jgi:hypothetical protein
MMTYLIVIVTDERVIILEVFSDKDDPLALFSFLTLSNITQLTIQNTGYSGWDCDVYGAVYVSIAWVTLALTWGNKGTAYCHSRLNSMEQVIVTAHETQYALNDT